MFIKLPHTQEIHLDNGEVRWIHNVTKIEQGKWYHLMADEGIEHITNPDKILFIRVHRLK